MLLLHYIIDQWLIEISIDNCYISLFTDVHTTLDDNGFIIHKPTSQHSSDSSRFKPQTTPLHNPSTITHTPSSSYTWGSSGYSSSSSHVSTSQLESQSSSQSSAWTDSKDTISSPKTLKSKCGNCGEVGHTRIDKACPRYYSLEESAHRKVSIISPLLPTTSTFKI